MKPHPQPYWLRLRFHGISHGLKFARQLSNFTPVCALGSAFRFPPAPNKNSTPPGCCSYLEQGTGIEPAFTAWEAVVLPIYEPCVPQHCTTAGRKKQPICVETFLFFSGLFLNGGQIAPILLMLHSNYAFHQHSFYLHTTVQQGYSYQSLPPNSSLFVYFTTDTPVAQESCQLPRWFSPSYVETRKY